MGGIIDREQAKQFMDHVNRELAPVLKINLDWRRHPQGDYPVFELVLCETAYADTSQVVPSGKFGAMVVDMAARFTDIPPAFNNTGKIFWLIK